MKLKTLLESNLSKAFGAVSYLNTITYCHCFYLVVKMQHVSPFPVNLFNLKSHLKAF